MVISFSEVVESEPPEWEPEALPLVEILPLPPRPRVDEAPDPEVGSRVVVIDLL